jgi:hypothetical protein
VKLNTASAAVRFAKQLEDESRDLYERVSERYPDWQSALAPFIRENKRNVGSIDRAYIGVVSDALDTQFAFEGIDTDDYGLVTALPDSPGEVAHALASNEEAIIAFYRAAADSSRDLLADVPRAFDRISSKRSRRAEALRTLILGL